MPRYTVDIVHRKVVRAKNKADAENTVVTKFMENIKDIKKCDIETSTEEILDNLDGNR